MDDDRRTVMASTFRAWWQSLADQDPDEIAAGNSLYARRLWTALVAVGKRNAAVITEPAADSAASPWAELDPDFDWNGEVVIGAEFETHDAIGLLAPRCDHDDGDGGAGAQTAADVQPVHVGQAEVQQDQVR